MAHVGRCSGKSPPHLIFRASELIATIMLGDTRNISISSDASLTLSIPLPKKHYDRNTAPTIVCCCMVRMLNILAWVGIVGPQAAIPDVYGVPTV